MLGGQTDPVKANGNSSVGTDQAGQRRLDLAGQKGAGQKEDMRLLSCSSSTCRADVQRAQWSWLRPHCTGPTEKSQ
jgi:hypothetical protein